MEKEKQKGVSYKKQLQQRANKEQEQQKNRIASFRNYFKASDQNLEEGEIKPQIEESKRIRIDVD